MSPQDSVNLDALLEAYLDGSLEPQARADAEKRLLALPAYARQIALQSQIDASIRRALSPPDEQRRDELLASARAAEPRRLQLVRRLTWVYAAAAAVLLIGLAGAWYFVQQASTGTTILPEVPAPVLYSFGDAYAAALRTGWKPDFICDNDQEFAGVTWKKTGQAMLLPAASPGLSVVGWTRLKTLSKTSLMLLVRVDDRPVAVYLDRREHDQPQPPTLSGGLRVFRREFNEAVLYEVTPQDTPHVLDQFFDPQQSIEWYIEGAENAW